MNLPVFGARVRLVTVSIVGLVKLSVCRVVSLPATHNHPALPTDRRLDVTAT